jgi:hypothetical protein
VLDDDHLMLAARYVALNPLRARLAQRPQDWAWSSLRAHLAGRDDGLVTVAPLLERLGGITALVDTESDEIAWPACAPPRQPGVHSARKNSWRNSKACCSATCDEESRDQRLDRRDVQPISSLKATAGELKSGII